jgi:hypothetical protein
MRTTYGEGDQGHAWQANITRPCGRANCFCFRSCTMDGKGMSSRRRALVMGTAAIQVACTHLFRLYQHLASTFC